MSELLDYDKLEKDLLKFFKENRDNLTPEHCYLIGQVMGLVSKTSKELLTFSTKEAESS